MRWLVVVLCPPVLVACSSFSSAPAVDAAGDGGAPLDAGGPEAGPPGTGLEDVVVLTTEPADGLTAARDTVFWSAGAASLVGVEVLPSTALTKVPPLSSGAAVSSPRTDGATLYWLEDSGGQRHAVVLPLSSGGIPKLLGKLDDPVSSLAGGVGAVTVSGGGSQVIYVGGDARDRISPPSDRIATTTSYVAYADAAGGALFEWSISGATTTKLASGLPQVSGIVADEDYVFVSLAEGRVVKIPHQAQNLDAGILPSLATFSTVQTVRIVADGAGHLVLWDDAGTALVQVGTGNGAQKTLLSDVRGVTSLAASPHGVFWTTSAGAMWLKYR